MQDDFEADVDGATSRERGPIWPAAPDHLLGRPLSIAMLAPCPFPTRQGTQVLIRHIATALARAGHHVHLVTYGYGEYEQALPFFLHRTAKIKVGLRSGPHPLKMVVDAALLCTAARVIKRYRCDVVHAHNVEGLAVGALLKAWRRTPLVYHAHNAMGPELPTYFHWRWVQGCASMVGDALDRTLPRAADAIITFDADHKALHEVYGVAEDKIHIIAPGLDGDEVNHAPAHLVEALQQSLGAGPILLYAGNPDNYQNLALMWRALARVQAVRPEVRLLVASNCDAAAFAPQMAQAGALQGVVFQKITSLDEFRAVHAVASVGLCPRALWTGAPIKILNYLAAGLPVVSCRAAARHIATEQNALLSEDEPQAFAAAILRLLEGGGPSHNAQKRAFDRFRIDTHVPAYEAVYRQVISAKRGPKQFPDGSAW